MKLIAMINLVFLTVMFLVGFNSCKKEKEKENNNSDVWLIPKDEVLDGGPGKDGIPSVDDPNVISIADVSFLEDDDLVIGVVSDGVQRAYPHPILDWHEIINDEVNGLKVAITYCPLTGTGIGWPRIIDGNETTFGVSGLLYNSNLIPYDRASNSNWSQIKLLCVNGELSNTEVSTIPIIETTWATWKSMYPQSKVVSTETGFNRSYGSYPYGDYKTNNSSLLFPISTDDSRLPKKERVHGIILNRKAKAYQFNNFPDSINVIYDTFENEKLVVVGSETDNFIVSFEQTLSDGTLLTFEPIQNNLPIILVDNEGTEWDISGQGVSGPRKGDQLSPTPSFIGYWFSWGTFYPGLEIY